jgi:NAD(P)H-dependent flavin oxidoreductase YrpB (nitropropane dioxygenase family)
MQSMRKLLDLLGIDVPVIQAPMAGASSAELVAAVANAGGLGSYGCSRLSPAQVIEEAERIRALTNRSFNLGFFCHDAPEVTPERSGPGDRGLHRTTASLASIPRARRRRTAPLSMKRYVMPSSPPGQRWRVSILVCRSPGWWND